MIAGWLYAGLLVLLANRCDAEPAAGVTLDQLPQAWRDDHARAVTLSEFRGRRIVLTMAYATCHRICPMTMEELKRLQQAADARGEAIEFVIVGYDPENDGPAAWRQYRRSRNLARDNWHFLTGSAAVTQRLARQLGFPFWKYDEHVMHESRAVLFDNQGVERAVMGPPASLWADAL